MKFSPTTNHLFLSFLLLTACASTPIKDPVLAGILEIERHPNTKQSYINSANNNCDIIGRDCKIGYLFCETFSSEKHADGAVKYYQKELTKIGWTYDKDGSFRFKNNRRNNTTLDLTAVAPYRQPPRVCFSFSENENYNNGQSDIMNALKTLEENK